jgi:hypothetical protein
MGKFVDLKEYEDLGEKEIIKDILLVVWKK